MSTSNIKGGMLGKIAYYFTTQYKGDDATAPPLELSVAELREIVAMNIELCRLKEEKRRLDSAPD